MRPNTERDFWARVEIRQAGQCWPWRGGTVKRHGYGEMRMRMRNVQAHRLSYEFTYGEIPDGMCVCHRCDNPPCCNPAHLFLGTKVENNDDRVRKGRSVAGERHHKSKLTWAQVCAVRERFAAGGVTKRALAGEYGISATAMGHILNGRHWRKPTGGAISDASGGQAAVLTP